MPKTKKLKIPNSKKWEPLKLEGAILSGDFEGLVGIEELVDYDVETCKKRRKISNNEEDSFDDESSKSKKKKQKVSAKSTNKKKKQKPVKIETNLPLPEEAEPDVASDEEGEKTEINTEAWAALGTPSVVISALADQGIVSPTLIQSMTLPSAILGRRDILGAAETGSGKTLAFGIPIINGILEQQKKLEEGATNLKKKKENDETSDSEECFSEDEETDNIGLVKVMDKLEKKAPDLEKLKPLYALILTPTRELAIQIKNHLAKAAKYTDIKIAVIVGGMAAVKQERILSKGPEIVIATPGRLWELINDGNPHLSQLDKINYLAIDETDRMLEKGHFEELHNILEKLNADETNVQQRQTFVFSATLTMVHDVPDYLQRKKWRNPKSRIFKVSPGQKLQQVIAMLGIKNPKIVDITKEKGTAGSLTECRIACTIDHKDYYLYYFLKRHAGKTLIFCNSIGCVQRLATLFGILECNPLPLHAKMIQRQRLKNLERFQEDKNGILIATDVAARGLDIPNVEHVIHYQVPRTSESYVHRSGRTARAQKEGITVLLMEPSEKQFYSRLCKTLGRSQDLPTFPVVDRLLIAVKEQVNIAREIDKLELKHKRNSVQKDWLRKAAEDMDLLLDDDERESTMEDKETADLKRALKAKKYQLSSLLPQLLFPKNFSGKYPDMSLEVTLDQNSETAIEVMKKVMDEGPKRKKSSSITEARKSRMVLKQKLKNVRRSKKKKEKKNKNNESVKPKTQ